MEKSLTLIIPCKFPSFKAIDKDLAIVAMGCVLRGAIHGKMDEEYLRAYNYWKDHIVLRGHSLIDKIRLDVDEAFQHFIVGLDESFPLLTPFKKYLYLSVIPIKYDFDDNSIIVRFDYERDDRSLRWD